MRHGKISTSGPLIFDETPHGTTPPHRKISTSGPLIFNDESHGSTPKSRKISAFGLGMGKEDEAPPLTKMSEEDCRKLTEIFDRERKERLERMEERRANRRAALVRQNNCSALDEEDEEGGFSQHQGTSTMQQQQTPPPPTRRQSSVNISFSSNVQLRKQRPRSSSDANATLISNLERFALKTPARPADAAPNNSTKKSPGRSVKFGNVEVFKFGFAQGFDTVPSDGTVSLGMETKHHAKHTFKVAEYARYKHNENQFKYKNWRLISDGLQAKEMERMKRKRKIGKSAAAKGINGQQQPRKKPKYADKAIEMSASEEHLLGEKVKEDAEEENDNEIGAEEGCTMQHQFFDQSRLSEQLRRALLANQGVQIDEIMANDTQFVVASRVQCGCRCPGGKCRPNTCECAKQGIECQVDFQDEDNIANNFPCICTAGGCQNPAGRTELNTLRIRQHYTQTLMRIKAARKLGFDWDDEKNSPQHTIFRDNDKNALIDAQFKTPSPNNRKKVAEMKMPSTFSTVSTQLRPKLAQVACSSNLIQSPNPFVTIRKRRPSPPLDPILGRDGIRRSMEVQEEEPEEEVNARIDGLPFPRSPSLLVTPKKNKRMQ